MYSRSAQVDEVIDLKIDILNSAVVVYALIKRIIREGSLKKNTNAEHYITATAVIVSLQCATIQNKSAFEASTTSVISIWPTNTGLFVCLFDVEKSEIAGDIERVSQ